MAESDRQICKRYFAALPADYDTLGELRHPDFVEDWPQTGERIRGHENYRKIHERYPGGTPTLETTKVTGGEERWVMTPSFTLIEISGTGDTYVGEFEASYPSLGPTKIITIVKLKDGKVHRQTTYFAPRYDPPDWRKDWVERI